MKKTHIDFIVLEWRRLTRTAEEVVGLRDRLSQSAFDVYFNGRLNAGNAVGIAACWRGPAHSQLNPPLGRASSRDN